MAEMRSMGLDVLAVPLYLPFSDGSVNRATQYPAFYGAVNVYLEQIMPGFNRLPRLFRRLFDAKPILDWVSRRAGSTRAAGLERLTLSMLRGEEGRQAAELKMLSEWLCHEGTPDIVHLSNGLLLGLGKPLRERFNCGIVCSLQDEAGWIDGMHPGYREQVWETMTEKAEHVDIFIGASHWYAGLMQHRMSLPERKIRVVYPGIRIPEAFPDRSPGVRIIGYLSRLSNSLGLGLLVDAFIRIKSDPRFHDVCLHAAGGMTRDDRKDLDLIMEKARRAGVAEQIRIDRDFEVNRRSDLLAGISLLSVPVPGGEAYGMHIPEAWSYGVPVVQPDIAGFAELIGNFGGGVTYSPNTPERLAEILADLLSSPERLDALGRQGRQAVRDHLCVQVSAAKIRGIYDEIFTVRSDGV